MGRPFWLAMQFLTRLPVPPQAQAQTGEVGRSLLAYPLVGLVIGLLLVAVAWAFGGAGPILGAALVVAAWVLATGALHLDGLADSADAWVGGHRDPARTLDIMKDPYSGPIGVAAVVVLLLVKFGALAALLGRGDGWMLLLPPLLGRAAVPALLLTTPYVRPGGIGEALASELPETGVKVTLGLVALGVVLALGGGGLVLLAVLVGCGYGVRRGMRARIGGTTGDTAGAMVELVETIALVCLALL